MSSDSSQQDGSESLLQGFFRRFSEEGLAGLLILGGVVLFFLPVPPISQIAGIVLLILGIIAWFSDWLWS